MTPASNKTGGFYGTGIERTKGKKTAGGTGTALLLCSADTGTGQLLRLHHGQRSFGKFLRYTVRPLQGLHRGNGPLIKIRSFL